MKTLKQTFLILITMTLFLSCSSDESESENNSTYQKLIGKWYFGDPTTNPIENHSFTFTSQGDVTYYYGDGTANSVDDYETGTFSVDGEVMTMIYPETVVLTFIQKVNFITDNKVEFLSTGNSGENAYEGIYYKE